jgi:sugar O-acyltransferase (sialic acid O-acetyltransferase NeuD family)
VTHPLIIIGAGGNLYDVLDLLDAIDASTRRWELRGVIDDYRGPGVASVGVPVVGALGNACSFEDCMFVSSIWNEKVFRNVHNILGTTRLDRDRYATLCHPAATVSRRATLGRDVLIHYGASVAGGVNIADHVSLGPGCTLGHDTTVDSYTCLAAGAILGGGVRVERNCYIGSGAMIRQHITIGEEALIGMGAVVIRDVPPRAVIVGNPGKVLDRISGGAAGVRYSNELREYK